MHRLMYGKELSTFADMAATGEGSQKVLNQVTIFSVKTSSIILLKRR